jgi:hypothetical protein
MKEEYLSSSTTVQTATNHRLKTGSETQHYSAKFPHFIRDIKQLSYSKMQSLSGMCNILPSNGVARKALIAPAPIPDANE